MSEPYLGAAPPRPRVPPDDTGRRPLSTRTRAWLWSACAAALALMYLVLWTLYSMTHLSSTPRFEQLAPGAAASLLQADFSLLSLVETQDLAVVGGKPPTLPAGALWVLATLQVVQHAKAPTFACSPELVGSEHQVWERADVYVDRTLSSFCADEDLHLDQPYRFEAIFEIPARYADQVFGVVLVDGGASTAQQVLTPPR